MKTLLSKNLAAIIVATVFITTTKAQNIFPSTGAAGIGTTTPNASSLLEIKSTTKGLLIPRMTQAQRNAIISPATGLMIYQTDATTGFYYYGGGGWKAVTAKAWSLTGNAGTNPSTNFLGTTDAEPLVFKVNNNNAGYLDYDNTKGNTGFGYQSLLSNASGLYNTAIGFNSLTSNSSGYYNTATGNGSLNKNTTASFNTANGYQALYSNTTGSSNTAVGEGSLTFNTTGNYNSALGERALNGNTNGSGNTASGAYALYTSTGNFNTAVGAFSFRFNLTGSNNTGIGYEVLASNNGNNNTASGYYALYNNITGNDNTAVGTSALYWDGNGAINSYDGVSNTAIGSQSIYNNTVGYNNTGSGYQSLYNNTTGYNNAAYGVQALMSNVSGIGNTALGVAADVNAGGLVNATAIGYYAKATASNQVMLGSPSVTSVIAAGNITIVSDGRFKKNIKANIHGLDFINQLQPVTYNYDIHKLNDYISPKKNSKDSMYANAKQDLEAAMQNKEKILYSGFVAQDVEAAAKKINYDFSGIHKPQNDQDPYGLSYSDFVVPLVKAVQELSKMNDDKDAKIDTLQKQLNDLKALVLSIQQAQQSCSACSNSIHQSSDQSASNQSAVVLTGAPTLQQNIPNPFTNTTNIGYTVPQKFTSAQIIITDKSGRTIKAVNVSGGKGNITVNASTLSSGAYQYSLIVDGRLIDTKQMELLK